MSLILPKPERRRIAHTWEPSEAEVAVDALAALLRGPDEIAESMRRDPSRLRAWVPQAVRRLGSVRGQLQRPAIEADGFG